MNRLTFIWWHLSNALFPLFSLKQVGRYFVALLAAIFLSVSCSNGGGGSSDGEGSSGPEVTDLKTEFTVIPHENFAELSWALPSEPIREIKVQIIQGGQVIRDVPVDDSGAVSFRVDDLVEGADYDFRVIFTYEDGSLGRLNKEDVRTGLNTDGDELIDADDPDDDNDGTNDEEDVFPKDPTETMDSDNDGTGDNADAFPTDPTETMDSDNDGTGDNADAFPNDPAETMDSDNDGTGDNADAFPNDPAETMDSDNDGTGDNADAFPTDPAETMDSDNDGTGDNADAFPTDPTETMDSDNDGTGDNADAFPTDPTETMDSDNDGTGDNADMNDDRDRLLDTDTKESLQNDKGMSCGRLTDCDGDGVNDDVDLDLDGDGLIEVQTQEELEGIHYVLNGTGRRFSEGEAVNVSGCGEGCRGYELVNNLTLSYTNSSGWQPLGGNASLKAFNRRSRSRQLGGVTVLYPYCQRGKAVEAGQVEADGFGGVFEGNGWTIHNLTIDLPDRTCVGLFAKARGEIRNLFIEGDRIIGKQLVGAVVGDGSFATIRNVHGRVRMVSGAGNSTIGGLVGSLYRSSLINSSAKTDSVTTDDARVGGLVGAAVFSNISGSAAMTINITGGNATKRSTVTVGGLVGYCAESTIVSSFSITERIKSITTGQPNQQDHQTGGLAGRCGGTIIDSYALSGTIEGRGGNSIGGLVGQLSDADVDEVDNLPEVIRKSYAITESISGRTRVGGLDGANARMFSSFAITANLDTSGGEGGGLQGDDAGSTIWNSYAISGTIDTGNNLGSGLKTGLPNEEIVASFGIVHTMRSPGPRRGGLIGTIGDGATLLSSYAMMANVSDSTSLGGLVGTVLARRQTSDDKANIIASYGVGNVSSPGLYRRFADSSSSGKEGELNIVSSYWDNLTGSREAAILRNGSLAAIWTNGTEAMLADKAIWCDLNEDEMIDMDERRPDNRIWDFGVRAEYPIIRCTPPNPLGLGQDRWRRLEGGKPNIPDSAELKELIREFRAEQRALFPQHIADQ